MVRVLDAVVARLPQPVRGLFDRYAEMVKFLLVGGSAFVIDSGVFLGLKAAFLEHKPITAKIISTVVATIYNYVLSREWSFRTRGGRRGHHEAMLFFLVSGLGVAVTCVPLWMSRYGLELRTPNVDKLTQEIADFVSAQIIGTLLATVFRWWAFRKFVFPHADVRPLPGTNPARAQDAGGGTFTSDGSFPVAGTVAAAGPAMDPTATGGVGDPTGIDGAVVAGGATDQVIDDDAGRTRASDPDRIAGGSDPDRIAGGSDPDRIDGSAGAEEGSRTGERRPAGDAGGDDRAGLPDRAATLDSGSGGRPADPGPGRKKAWPAAARVRRRQGDARAEETPAGLAAGRDDQRDRLDELDIVAAELLDDAWPVMDEPRR